MVHYIVLRTALIELITGLIKKGSDKIKYFSNFPVWQGTHNKCMSFYLLPIKEIEKIAVEFGTYEQLTYSFLT